MTYLTAVCASRKFFRLCILTSICTLLTFAVPGDFSITNRLRAGTTSKAPKVPPTLAATPTHSAAAQTLEADVLLGLSFENSTFSGANNETPTQSSNILQQPSLIGNGVFLDRNSRLTYDSTGNINGREGTIELWLRPNWAGTDSQSHTILRYGNSGGLWLGHEAGKLRFILNRANVDGSLELDVLADIQTWRSGDWHHVAASWSNAGQFMRLYVDGTLASERSLATTLPALENTLNPTLQIGSDGLRAALVAIIDEVYISDGPRTSLEIANRTAQSITITGTPTMTPAGLTSISLVEGWSYWQDIRFNVTGNGVPLTLPFLAAGLTFTNAGAKADDVTGRIRGESVGAAKVTATLGGTSSEIMISVTSKGTATTETKTETNSSVLTPIKVAIIRYIPTTNSTTVNTSITGAGVSSSLSTLTTKLTALEKNLEYMLEEGSRFRGYKEAGASASLGYEVVRVITVNEDVPPGLPSATSGVYFPDYKQIFARLGIKSLVETTGVKEIWLEQYVNGRITLNESNMASPLTGDISQSLRTNDDLPVYAKSYTVFGINYAQVENMAARNQGHHLEALISYANLKQDGDTLLFKDSFVGDTSSNLPPGRCGNTNRPPNSTVDNEYDRDVAELSDIENWNPDQTGVHTLVNATTWGGRPYTLPTPPTDNAILTEDKWHIYWRQAIPGNNNTIKRGETENLTNWWRLVADWDNAVKNKIWLTVATNCQYSLSTATQNIDSEGGTGTVTVAAGPGCAWTATESLDWVTINSGASGVANGTVTYAVAANTGSTRVGDITIGGQKLTITQQGINPIPKLDTIAPSTVVAGESNVTLTLDGTNFAANAVVQINTTSRTTQFVNDKQLKTTLTAADLATGGNLSITAFNPAPGGGTTVAKTLTINNPIPSITSLSQSSIIVGNGDLSLTITGTNFNSASKARWNGADRTTSVVSATQLTVTIPASDLTTASTANITVFNPTPAGGTSNTREFSINNPAPTLANIAPTTVVAGSAALTLTVNGTNFLSTSKVRWKGTDRTTTFVSATQLTATIPATDLVNAGTADVTVFNPTPVGGTSPAITFSINNPAPTLGNIAPTTVMAGSGTFTLTVNGTNFLSTSKVRWNGADRTTTFLSATQMTASINAADVASAGSASVTVFTPTPGGGATAASTFTITAACSYTIAPSSQNFAAAGGSGSTNITAGTGCAWTAINNPSWITFSTNSGTGNGTLNFTVAANTGAARTGTFTVQGQTFTVTQDAAAATCVAQRTLPTEYFATVGVAVTLQVTPGATTQSYAVEETPPTGWTVSAIDNNGQFDAVNGKVKWGPFFDATARTLKYTATPPSGTTGQKTFAGAVSINGISSTTCGTTSIAAGNPLHPADLNNNLRLEINELTAYGAAWKSGSAWTRPPNPIDINYLTNAGLLWKLGEVYHFDITKTPPFATGASVGSLQLPVPLAPEKSIHAMEAHTAKLLRTSGYMPGLGVGFGTLLKDLAATETNAMMGGGAVSGFSVTNYTPGVGFTVTISITPDAGTQVYAVEDTIPSGWAVSNVNNSGAFDGTNRKVKWGPFFDNSARVLTYFVTPPTGETGIKTFAGTVSFDGTSVIITGTRNLSNAPTCTYTLGASNQSFTTTGGAGNFTIAVPTGCAWTASTTQTWITITQGTGSGNGSIQYTVAANAGAARTGTITVAGLTFTVNQSANVAPTITAASALSRQQGATATAATIATVSDTETATSSLLVTATSVPTGLSVSNITNTNGTISAVVTASCLATTGANTIVLRVTDGQGAATQTNLTVNVTSSPSCFLQTPDTSGSDQRLGSVLLYSYYTSVLSNATMENTQIRLTNTHDTQEVAVRLYFVDAQSGAVFSLFVCLPPTQTFSFLMSETDPSVTGYLIAVAVNKATGCPINFNHLAGSAAIKLSTGYTANLGAVAVAALATNPTTCATSATSTTLNFDGTNYSRLPRLLVVDNLGSIRDGNNTRLIVTRVGGSLIGTASGVGAISGKVYNGSRAAQDFSFSASTPQSVNTLSATFPRLTTRLDNFIPAGQNGWMKLWTDASWGLIGSVMNVPTNPRMPGAFVGGFNLQQGALANAVSLEVPISVPTCQ